VPDAGYVSCPEENLLSSVQLSDFYIDLEAGSGNELQKKFCALHSSSALAVNVFAKWKNNPSDLFLCEKKGFQSLTFEKKCPTGLGGTPPNLDVFLVNDNLLIAIESKFLEYLTPKKGFFSTSYTKENLPQSEKACWYLIDRIKEQPKQYLDAAQLVKHYFGLRNLPHTKDKEIVLLYLFWEPENWKDFDIFKRHRSEIKDFASYFDKLSVKFIYQSYPELWDEWEQHYKNTSHVSELRERYYLTI
jgi:hypothetical protein